MSKTSRVMPRYLFVSCFVAMILLTFSTTIPAGASVKTGYRLGTIDTAAEQDFLNRTNSLRASLGLGPLKTNGELLTKARGWSQTQAAAGTIFHSTLTDGVTQNWHRLGENVGMGPDVASIHDALVRSPRHYENLVDSGFTDVGIGVVRQGDVIYVSQVFMQLMPENTQTTQQTSPPVLTNKSKSSGTTAATSSTPEPSSQPSTPVAQAAPLKTASEELNAVIQKLSALES